MERSMVIESLISGEARKGRARMILRNIGVLSRGHFRTGTKL